MYKSQVEIQESVDKLITCRLTKEERLSIPIKFLRKVGLGAGDNVYLLPVVNPTGIEILDYNIISGQKAYLISTDGRLRLSLKTLQAHNLEGDTFNIGLTENRNSIIIEKG